MVINFRIAGHQHIRCEWKKVRKSEKKKTENRRNKIIERKWEFKSYILFALEKADRKKTTTQKRQARRAITMSAHMDGALTFPYSTQILHTDSDEEAANVCVCVWGWHCIGSTHDSKICWPLLHFINLILVSFLLLFSFFRLSLHPLLYLSLF